MAKTKNEAKPAAKPALSTGEAAAYLTAKLGHLRSSGGFSLNAVRRLVRSGELSSSWSRSEVSFDLRGYEMRGHRRILRSSVDAFVSRELRRAASEAKTTDGGEGGSLVGEGSPVG